jgi:site-specific recombinase XerD
MNTIYDQIKRELVISGKSENTQDIYLRSIRQISDYYHKSPGKLSTEEIKDYLFYLIDKKRSYACVHQTYYALKFFFEKVLHNTVLMESIPKAQFSRKRIPQVLAKEEIKALLNTIKNLKHRTILLTIYSGGLRVSEAARLRVSDIDSNRMLIRVNQGKGRKDRYTILSNVNLYYLRAYYKAYHPETWLFNGWTKDKPISARTIQEIFYKARDKAGTKKDVSVHYQKETTSFGGGPYLPIFSCFEGFAFYILLIWQKPPALQVVFYYPEKPPDASPSDYINQAVR